MESTKLILQHRDIDLLRGLFECRVMTAKQIGVLYFDSKHDYAKTRLRRLKNSGFIGSRKRNANEPAVLFLTRKAFKWLTEGGHLSGLPRMGTKTFESRVDVSHFTIAHELQVIDIKVAFHAALAKAETYSLLECSTWPLMHTFKVPTPTGGTDATVRPDGFIQIAEESDPPEDPSYRCFFELDRSSKTLDELLNQATNYQIYFRSGGFAVRFGGTMNDIQKYPFRVLFVLKSAERRNNMAEMLLSNNPPILRMVWLTTFAEATTDPLGKIWIRPLEYRTITRETRFAVESRVPSSVYRRDKQREDFVEANIKKLEFFEDA